MTTANFSTCVSAIMQSIKEEASKGVKMPTTVKVYLPSEDGTYSSSKQPVASLYYFSGDESDTFNLELDELLSREAGSLAGRALCAVDLPDPLIEDLEKAVAEAVERWGCGFIEFSCFEVSEHTATVIRGVLRAYLYAKGKLMKVSTEPDEEMLILLPANA